MIKNIRDFSKYFLIPTCCFYLFKKGIDLLLSKFIVAPILSKCAPANIVYDIAIGILFFALIIPVFHKISAGARIPTKWIYLSISYLLIYSFYRIANTPFHFTALSFYKEIKLLDVINSIPLFCIVWDVIHRLKKILIYAKVEAIEKIEIGFTVDEARKIDNSNDLLNRIKFIKEIANKIKNTKTETGSFPIGIVANWGAGKSTFINTLVDEFPRTEFIVIELNVWKCSNSFQIIETLFKLLKLNLKPYSFTIDNKLQDYTTNLLKGTKIEGLNGIKNLTDLLLPNASIEKQYDSINDEIKQIGRKIIIIIDDLDRLDKKEIYEVIRLIRNTANFANTFFVAAYDRNYILNAIEEINPYQSHYFLEKIFQVEFILPPIDNKVIQEEITRHIETFLTENGKKEYQVFIKRGLDFFEYGYADLTSLFILNIRDVVRFINSFKLSYEFVKDEIHLPDFYNLELIRFKHPELFSVIYKNRYRFFTTNKDHIHKSATLDNLYCLSKTVKDGKTTEIFELSEYIDNEKDIYKLTNKEIEIICRAFSSIFPEIGSSFSTKQNSINYRLTVLKPSMFDRYFLLDIGGNLSNVVFSKIRSLPMDEFIQEISEISKNEDKVYDLLERISEIRNFDNKQDFKKIISGIFHFANLPYPNNENNQPRLIGFNIDKTAAILGDVGNMKLFGNREEYKQFLSSFFKTKGECFTSTDELIRSLLGKNHYTIAEIYTSEELSQLAFENFSSVLSKSKKLTAILWHHLWNCLTRNETPSHGHTSIVTYPINKKAKQLIRNFIFQNDMDGFLLMSIREVPFDEKFIIEGVINEIFRSVEIFIWLLRRFQGESTYRDEFLKLYDILKTSPGGVSFDFFKVIPVKLREPLSI